MICRLKSKVGKAKSTGISKRVTIPKPIAEMLEVELGDEIWWEVRIIDDEFVITVKKGK